MAGDNDYGDGSASSIARDAASKIQQTYTNKVPLPPEDPRGPPVGYGKPLRASNPGRIIGIGPDHYDLDK